MGKDDESPKDPPGSATPPGEPAEAQKPASTAPAPPRPNRDEGDALLHHPDVLKVVWAIFREVGCRRELEDLVHEILAKAWNDTRRDPDPPKDVPRWKAVVRPRAYTMAINALKREVRDGRRLESGEVDFELLEQRRLSAERDVVDQKQAVRALLDMPKPQHGQEILDGVQAGEKISDVARQLNIPEKRAHKIMEKMRSRFRGIPGMAGLALVGGGVTGIVMLVVTFVTLSRPGFDDVMGPAVQAVQATRSQSTARQDGDAQFAAAYTAAEAACEGVGGQACLDLAARARTIAPESGAEAQVAELAEQIDVQMMRAKTGWVPPKGEKK